MKPKPSKPGAKKKILLVDDDPQILEVFAALLEEAGYEVEKAEHALAAVAAIVRARPTSSWRTFACRSSMGWASCANSRPMLTPGRSRSSPSLATTTQQFSFWV